MADRAVVEAWVLRVLRPVVIAALVAVTLFPFWYLLVLSVRPIEEVLRDPDRIWAGPAEWTARAYRDVLTPAAGGGQGCPRFLANSALVSVATTALTLAVSLPGAYAMSRLRFLGRRQVHFLFLSVYLFPPILLAIPLFVLFTRLGLRGSLAGLMIVYVAQTLPVSILMLRHYLDAIPESLEEAAAVDGYSRLQTLRKIVLPLAAPAVVANALYVFMIAWNEFLFALLFLVEERQNWTVSLGLSQLKNIETPATTLMAGSVILTLPVIVLFMFAERMMTEGLTRGGVKG